MKDKKAKQVKVYRWMGVPNLLEFADVYSVEKKVATYIEPLITSSQTSLEFIKNFYGIL